MKKKTKGRGGKKERMVTLFFRLSGQETVKEEEGLGGRLPASRTLCVCVFK